MDHRFWGFRTGMGVPAGLTLTQATAMAARKAGAGVAYGRWSERGISNLDFDIRPGAKPDQLLLVIPASVTFPGNHEFVLAKRGDGSFEAAAEPDRPKVSLSFQSASKAKLKIRGQGSTAGGTWIAMNDFTLVRR